MSQYKVFKFKLIPKKSQKIFLDKMFEEANNLWKIIIENSLTDDRLSKNFKTTYLGSQLKQNLFIEFKNLLKSQRELKKINKSGKIKFKNKRVLNAWSDQPIRFKDNKLKIQKLKSLIYIRGLKQLKALEKENIKYKFVTFQLIKKIKGYYLHVIVKIKNKPKKPKKVLGIDFGIKDQLILSNGYKINYFNSRLLRKSLSRIKRLQKALSRKIKNSNNFYKLKKKLSIAWENYNFALKEIHNKIISILKNYFLVFQNEMIKSWHQSFKGIRKRVQRTSIGFLKSRLKNYEHQELSSSYATTKTCLKCNQKNNIDLSQREFQCSFCGFKLDRDFHSSLNMLKFIGFSFKELFSEKIQFQFSEKEINNLKLADISIIKI